MFCGHLSYLARVGSPRGLRRNALTPQTVGALAISRLRLEYRELALHKRVAIARECAAVVSLELLDLAAVHSLPRALMADVIGQNRPS